MEKILITGASGYLGQRLFHFLQGHGEYQVLRTSRATSQKDTRHFTLENFENYEEITREIDIVIHLAGSNSQYCEMYPENAYIHNTEATLKLYESCVKNKVRLFIFMSTAHVYGSPLAGEIKEEISTNPKSVYAKTKDLAEKLLKKSQNQTKILSIRLSNIVGAPFAEESCDWRLIVNSLCRELVFSNKIILKTNGMGVRNFISIRDFESCILKLLKIDLQDYLTLNLGGERNYKMIEIANLIAEEYEKITNNKAIIFTGDVVDSSTAEFRYNIGLAKEMNLNLSRKINKDINETILFCFKNFKNV